MENFDVRLSSYQISFIIDALQKNSIIEGDEEKRNEINDLVEMFRFVEKDVLNSFVD